MSAFVVDKAHINAMIDAGLSVRYRPMHWYPEGKEGSSSLTEINASEVGQILLEECIKSVGYRYCDLSFPLVGAGFGTFKKDSKVAVRIIGPVP
ncbi:unnamed protein product [marine sediment metagenome]|uniref:Uncharacterized protein n=1 Tax=marine sediment metagenome TaxID=412755 RepID=X1N983_9ZZZZ